MALSVAGAREFSVYTACVHTRYLDVKVNIEFLEASGTSRLCKVNPDTHFLFLTAFSDLNMLLISVL